MQTNTQALNLEQPTPTPSLNQLHHAFAELCHVYGDLNHYYGLSQYVDSKRVDWMQDAITRCSSFFQIDEYNQKSNKQVSVNCHVFQHYVIA